MEKPDFKRINFGPGIIDLLQADALGKLEARLNKRKNWLVLDQTHRELYDMGIRSGLSDCNRLKVPVEDILEVLRTAPRVPKIIPMDFSPPEPTIYLSEGP